MSEKITIIGAGKVGTSLRDAIQLSAMPERTELIEARTERYEIDSEIVIIAVRDDAVATVARRVIESASEDLELLVQVAGSIPSTALAERAGVSRLTLHPIQTFADPDAELFRGIYWMAASAPGDDDESIPWAQNFVHQLGGKGIIQIENSELPLYHAMTVFGSNFITLLLAAIEEIASELDLDTERMKEALMPLSYSALRNAFENPAKSVLTGPIARKDLLTIRKHQIALAALNPKIKGIYDAFFEYANPKTRLHGTPKR